MYRPEAYLARPTKDGRRVKKGAEPFARRGDAGTIDRRAGAAAEWPCEMFEELRRGAKWGDLVKVRLDRTSEAVWLPVDALEPLHG